MADPEDPRQVLRTGDVRGRAAAARELVARGEWEDIDALVEAARSDKSPSVRLYAAAAAADLAAQRRGAGGQVPLFDREKAQVFAWLNGVDPEKNPGLLLLLAAVGDARAIERIGRVMRDPRNVVRTGAIAALRRTALSGAAIADTEIPDAVRAWLDSGKLAPDAVLELARLIGECGWSGFDAQLRKAAGAGRNHVGVVEEARQRLALRGDPAAWTGVWTNDGRDVLEPGEPRVSEWFLVDDGVVYRPGEAPAALELGDAPRIGGAPARLVLAPRVGQPGHHPAIQVGGFTWWKVDGRALVDLVDAQLDGIAAMGEGARPLVGWLGAVDGPLAQRAQALILMHIGALAEARTVLEALAEHKRPRADVYWLLARVRLDLGDRAAAREPLVQFLEKAGKKADHRAEAEQLLADLG